jgi:hypothetical protein
MVYTIGFVYTNRMKRGVGEVVEKCMSCSGRF